MNDLASFARAGRSSHPADPADDSSRVTAADYGMTPVDLAPHSAEAEQAVLGALLLEPKAFERVREAISSGDFFAYVHRSIFDAIVGCVEAGTPVDLFTVAEQLRTAGELEAIGGHAYLLTLTNSTGSEPPRDLWRLFGLSQITRAVS